MQNVAKTVVLRFCIILDIKQGGTGNCEQISEGINNHPEFNMRPNTCQTAVTLVCLYELSGDTML